MKKTYVFLCLLLSLVIMLSTQVYALGFNQNAIYEDTLSNELDIIQTMASNISSENRTLIYLDVINGES